MKNKMIYTFTHKNTEPGIEEKPASVGWKSRQHALEEKLTEYLEVLDQSGYRLTGEVEQFRKKAAPIETD